jgi:hypothetical protein
VNHRKTLSALVIAGVLFSSLGLAGCRFGNSPTPEKIYVTPSPTATPEETPTPEPTATPEETGSPEATATPEETPTPEPTATPTELVTPPPGGYFPASSCTGRADQQTDFIAPTAAGLRWDLYCGVLPTGWWLDSGNWAGNAVDITYKANPKTASGPAVRLDEGPCVGSKGGCLPAGATEIGSANYGDRAGTLYSLAGDPSGYTFAIHVSGSPEYLIRGRALSQSNFVAIAGALIKVAKS